MKALVAHFQRANVRVWTYGGAKPKHAAKLNHEKLRFVAHRRLGTVWALLAEGREAGIELAGYRLGAAMVRDLENAAMADDAKQELVKLADLDGAALWLRSEPGEDAALSAALAARIVADLAR